ncbi:hypothetical protein PSTG_09834 [Puccinia striiformis f. sp. tritici PST-78]|uniref:Uncharacterized protein n=1 Tax=Puccinia striiformis f. sp. tritici PST-78 TaxID=1165861 RepID=A0A0L0VCB2_9BASI|nr:hypothetical protein PSTG_09834 [Puccinia striiformis f. sp. tritici PST-78]
MESCDLPTSSSGGYPPTTQHVQPTGSQSSTPDSSDKDSEEEEEAHKQSNRILSLSTTADLPDHRSKLSKSIVDFIKGMIGCAGMKFKLPLSPSQEEIEQWSGWLDTRQDAVTSGISTLSKKDKATKKSEIKMVIRNHSQKLKKAPPPWKKPNLGVSDWNSAAANILASNWYQWTKAKQPTALTDAEQEQITTFNRHKTERGNIAKLCFKTARAHFPKQPHIAVMVKDIDTVSDYEDSPTANEDPASISLVWRSDVFNKLVAELDKATVQMAKPGDWSTLSARLLRNGRRMPTEEEEEMYPISSSLPRAAYSEEILLTCSILEKDVMGIPKTDDPYTLPIALAYLKTLTAYETSTGAATEPDEMQVDSTRAHQTSSAQASSSHQFGSHDNNTTL